MAVYTAKAIAQLAEQNGARLPTISATPDVDDIEEPSSPQMPSGLLHTDEGYMSYFWKFIATKQQHFRCLQKAPASRTTGQPIHIDTSLNPSMSHPDGNSKSRNTSDWTPEEDQILFDGLLIGNIPHLWQKLDQEFGRTEQDVHCRARDLTPDRLPQCWCLPREEAYLLVRKRTHDGETELSEDEWKELVLWINNDYVGIDPSIFHWTRSAERLRQEVRIFDELHFSIFDRVAKIFLAEKVSNPRKKPARGLKYKEPKKQSEEAKERRQQRNAAAKEQREKARAETKGGRDKKNSERGEEKKDGFEKERPEIRSQEQANASLPNPTNTSGATAVRQSPEWIVTDDD